MTHWEYRMSAGQPGMQDVASSTWAFELNALGQSGWELVAERVIQLAYGQVQYSGTFKRVASASSASAQAGEGFAGGTERGTLPPGPQRPNIPTPGATRSVAPTPDSPTPGRLRVLQGLVAAGDVTEEEAQQLAPKGHVNDIAWAEIRQRRGAS